MLGHMHAKGTKTGLLPKGTEAAALLAHEALMIIITGVLSSALLQKLSGPWSLPIAHLCQTPLCTAEEPTSQPLKFVQCARWEGANGMLFAVF